MVSCCLGRSGEAQERMALAEEGALTWETLGATGSVCGGDRQVSKLLHERVTRRAVLWWDGLVLFPGCVNTGTPA